MDLKLVIREMLRKGVSQSEIIENLNELGVQDAEKVFADAVKDYKPPAPAPVPTPKQPEKPTPIAESKPTAEKPASLFGSLGKSLFGGPAPAAKPVVVEKPLQAEEKKPVIEKPVPKPVVIQKETEEEELSGIDALIEKTGEPAPAVEKKPVPKLPVVEEQPAEREPSKPANARITKIDDYGAEKEFGMADFLSKEEKPPAIIKKISATSIDEIEERLDETIALLKALQDINKRILETDRQVLLRLQK